MNNKSPIEVRVLTLAIDNNEKKNCSNAFGKATKNYRQFLLEHGYSDIVEFALSKYDINIPATMAEETLEILMDKICQIIPRKIAKNLTDSHVECRLEVIYQTIEGGNTDYIFTFLSENAELLHEYE